MLDHLLPPTMLNGTVLSKCTDMILPPFTYYLLLFFSSIAENKSGSEHESYYI